MLSKNTSVFFKVFVKEEANKVLKRIIGLAREKNFK